MKYNLLGNTGLRVSELCLGTMTFGGRGRFQPIGQLQQEEVDDLMKSSVDAGINFIDTANVYSEGWSEELTGQSIRNLGLSRHELVLATKVRGAMGTGVNEAGLSRKHIFHQLDQSLKRLNTDYIDLYQIHGFDALTPLEETLDVLYDVVKSGKVRYIGASNLAAWHLMKALSYSAFHRISKFVSLQALYTLANRELEREIVPLLKDQKTGLMVWSPLAGGILTGKYKRDNTAEPGSRRINFDFPIVDKEKAFNIVDVLTPMANEKRSSVAQLAIAWLLHQPVTTTVIIGAKTSAQLADNIRSSEVKFTADELQKLDEVSKLAPEYPGWMIEFQAGDRKL